MAIMATIQQRAAEPTVWMPALSLAVVLTAFSAGVWVGRVETAERISRIEEQLAGHVRSGPHTGGVSREVWTAEIQRFQERHEQILAQIIDIRRAIGSSR